jgi:hypothetical protein
LSIISKFACIRVNLRLYKSMPRTALREASAASGFVQTRQGLRIKTLVAWASMPWYVVGALSRKGAAEMTLEEALAEIERLGRGGVARRPVAEEEVSCRDTQQAVRLLAVAYEHLQKRDPLYAGRRRCASLAPPPASVPPG